jgi:hypothetical protein
MSTAVEGRTIDTLLLEEIKQRAATGQAEE